MSTISGKINFLNLTAAIKTMKGASGDIECLVIPIERNHLFKGEKGVYLDLIAFEIKDKKNDQKDTHLLKQSLPKEIRDSMSKEQLDAQPILGNLMVWDSSGEREPVSSSKAIAESSDLPF